MRRTKAPATTSRRGGLALMRRLIVFRQAPARRAIRTLEPAKPRIRRSAERKALGFPLCAQHVPKHYVPDDTLKYTVALNGMSALPSKADTCSSQERAMDFRFETLKVIREGGVLFVNIAAPPMNLLGPELVRDLVSLIQGAE